MLSILEPSLDDLMKRVGSKYALVVAAAKRGRQITEGRERVVEGPLPKPVSLALDEIARGVLQIDLPDTGREGGGREEADRSDPADSAEVQP